MIIEFALALAFVAIAALVISAALAPLETLSWWAGWTEQELRDSSKAHHLPDKQEQTPAQHFIIYLSGVASISGRYLLPRERAFLEKLSQQAPDCKIIDSVFPYSPRGMPLLARPRFFERIWRRVQSLKAREKSSFLAALINIRNI